MRRVLLAGLVSGALFGAGLVISGMTDPGNIQAFLDVMGDFRPTLALVMVGAILVYAVAIRLPTGATRRRPFASIGPSARVDARLLVGAALFGVGWGLGGYCPGPSLVALGAGQYGAVVFVGMSIVGLLLGEWAVTRRRDRQADQTAATESSAVGSG